jgi:hypothetical protein
MAAPHLLLQKEGDRHKFVSVHAIKACGAYMIISPVSLDLGIGCGWKRGNEWSPSGPGRFNVCGTRRTHWRGGSVDLTVALDFSEKIKISLRDLKDNKSSRNILPRGVTLRI